MPANQDNACCSGDDANSEKTVNIFRFKFTDEIAENIANFSKVHQYDDRKVYKENWEEWLGENNDIISREESRLLELGYDKDVKDKMFKAGRYYFRKKDRVPPVPVKRRTYVSISHQILNLMDSHITSHMNNDEYTPAKGYDSFCEAHTASLSTEIQNILAEHQITSSDMASKIKKTYKNRYYIISRA